MTPFLDLTDIDIAYPPRRVIQDLSLRMICAGIGCLLGPSGCGKTTLLRAIAGFEPVRQGSIRLEGVELSRPGWTLPPEQRRIGLMFQDLALFPHLTIADNVAFGLRGWKAEERRARVRDLLRLVGLDEYAKCYPHQISGGQQQRVALARALAPRPRLLLLDEPFSSLDVTLREDLAREIRTILLREGIGGLLVSHDQFEAFAFADEIGVLHEGRLLQWDNAYNLYHRPADRFVADFIGQGVLLPGRIGEGGRVCTELGHIDSAPASRLRAGRRGGGAGAAGRRDPRRCQPADRRGGGAGVPGRGVPVHPQAAQWRAVAVPGAQPSQPRAGTMHRHPAGHRPSGDVSAGEWMKNRRSRKE